MPATSSFFFNPFAIPNIIVSSIILVVGLFVFLQNPRNPTHIFFFLFCLSLNFWLYGRAIMYCCRRAEDALIVAKAFAKLGVVNIAPLVYTFSVFWLGLYNKQKKFVWAAFIIAPIFYFTILLTPYGLTGVRRYFWGYYPVYGPVCDLFLLFFFTYFNAAFYNFFGVWKKTQDPAKRKQIRIVTIAYLISFTGSVDFIPKVINFPFYPWGYLSVFAWTMIVAYAIVRYRMMDIQTVIHKTLMWFASMTVALIPFVAGVYFIHDWILSLNHLALSFLFIGICLTFSVYLRKIQPLLDKVFQRRSANLSFVLNRFSAELVHLKSLRDILQGTVRTIRRNLYTREISIFLKDQKSDSFVPVIAKRVRGLKPVPFSHPVLNWVEAEDTVMMARLMSSNPKAADFSDPLAEYLEATGAAVVMPLVLGGKLIGMVHLGHKEGLRRYTSEEITFLSRLKSPVSIAISNALHVIAMQENLQKWNEELEQKVEERTRQLQETQAQLIQAEKLATIGTLAGGVAHEINNPLTAVLANAQMLRMTAAADDLESISLIEEGAKRCQFIIQKLMKYARKPIGIETVGAVNINKVAENTIALLNYQLNQENIKVILAKSENMPTFEGNANELEQVLTNLILNAKDAIKNSGRPGLINISSEHRNGQVILKVKDNGTGIAKENRPRIYDPFFTTKEIGKGTGLGLAVSFGIVQKHHGRISVDSEPGMGTEFELSFDVKGEA